VTSAIVSSLAAIDRLRGVGRHPELADDIPQRHPPRGVVAVNRSTSIFSPADGGNRRVEARSIIYRAAVRIVRHDHLHLTRTKRARASVALSEM
jgi:hypothetical protein